MTQAIIDIPERTNKILNIVKAQMGLKDKSQAIERVVQIYEESFMEPEIRPEYAEKLLKIKQEKGTKYSHVAELRADIENA